MRIARTIIVPAVLALGVAGSALLGSAVVTAAAHGPAVAVHAVADPAPSTAPTPGTNMYHHG